MKKLIILFFCMIFVSKFINAQEKTLKVNTVKDFINNYFYSSVSSTPPTINKTAIPSNFYIKNLSFFCRQELKFAAATGIPVKLRLGSVQYCDWMEGKKNAGILPAK